MRRALAIVGCLLAACGGGTVAVITAPSQPPSAPEPAAPEPAASAAQPAQPAPSEPAGPGIRWRADWGEPWTVPLGPRLGGWVRHGPLNCQGGTADPDRAPEGAYVGGYDWTPFGTATGQLEAAGGALHIQSYQHGGGYALLSGRIWPVTQPLAVQTWVDLRPDPYAWLGVTLIADESDFRELALYERDGGLYAGVWSPCSIAWGVAAVAPGPRRLRIEYTPPPAVVCWRHYVDGLLVHSERCDAPGAPLANRARVGLYIVNLGAEGPGRVGPGWVRAELGPITLETWP